MGRSFSKVFLVVVGGLGMTGDLLAGKDPLLTHSSSFESSEFLPTRSTSRFSFVEESSDEETEGRWCDALSSESSPPFWAMENFLGELEDRVQKKERFSPESLAQVCEDFGVLLETGVEASHLARFMKTMGAYEKDASVIRYLSQVLFADPEFSSVFYGYVSDSLDRGEFNPKDLVGLLEGHGRLGLGMPQDVYAQAMRQMETFLSQHILPGEQLVDLFNAHWKWGADLPFGVQDLWEKEVYQRLQFHGFTADQLVKIYGIYARRERPLPPQIGASLLASLERKKNALSPQNVYNLFYAQALGGIFDEETFKACQKNVRAYTPSEWRLIFLGGHALGKDFISGLSQEDRDYVEERKAVPSISKCSILHRQVRKILQKLKTSGRIQEVQENVLLNDLCRTVHFYLPQERLIIQSLSSYLPRGGTSFRLEEKIARDKNYRILNLKKRQRDLPSVIEKALMREASGIKN